MPVRPAKPSWRKPAGIFLILLLIAAWAWLMVSIADHLPRTWLLRGPFFIAAGLVWILPLKPLLRWMETGEWREAIRSSDKAPPP
ncbi:MAG TPA: DUF2842 domain-containing protein [Allosphingosinicella sp.]|nr:DUF2842 domain-containing protein [Allosphingosinicella sp.]